MKLQSVVSLSILVLTATLCIPAFIDTTFAKVYTIFSNIAYIAPLFIAITLKNYHFVIILSLIILVSTLYHSCKAYDVCFRLEKQNWEAIDVQYSWFLLLTVASFLSLPKNYNLATPINVLILIWSHAAQCKDYDCRNSKLVYLSIYVIIGVVKSVSNYKIYVQEDSFFAIAFFTVASAFYLFGNSDAAHSAWHVTGAASIGFGMTMLSNSKFHLYGLKDEEATIEEKTALLDTIE